MPPRFAYWTILAGGLPTSFRSVEQEDLLPTFNRLKEKQPDAEMKWFAKGQLWSSPEEARAASPARPWSRRPEDAASDKPPARPPVERRGRAWRPGGEHADPRQKFKDAKKARNQDVRRQRWEHKNKPEYASRLDRPRPDAPRDERPRREDNRGAPPRDTRPRGDAFSRASFNRERPRNQDGDRRLPPRSGSWSDSPREDRPRDDWRGNERGAAPSHSRPTGQFGGGRDQQPDGSKPAWRPKPAGSFGGEGNRRADGHDKPPWKPSDRKPFGDRQVSREAPRPFPPRDDTRSETSPRRFDNRPSGGFSRDRASRLPSGGWRVGSRDEWSERPSVDRERRPFRPKPDRPFTGERRDFRPKFESRPSGTRPPFRTGMGPGTDRRPRGEWTDRKPTGGGFGKPHGASSSGNPAGGGRPGRGSGKPAFGARKPWSSSPPRAGGAPRRPFKPSADNHPSRRRGGGNGS